MQHGHLDQVGYDTYCKLLDEVVKEMKGIKEEEEIDVQIDIAVGSYIPDSSIENSSQKIEIYQNIALCKNEEDIGNVIDEIIDRYGKMPQEVENLIEVARIKNQCRKIGITKVQQKQNAIVFYFEPSKFQMEMVDTLIQKFRNRIKFSPAKEPYITFKIENMGKILEEIKEFLNANDNK